MSKLHQIGYNTPFFTQQCTCQVWSVLNEWFKRYVKDKHTQIFFSLYRHKMNYKTKTVRKTFSHGRKQSSCLFCITKQMNVLFIQVSNTQRCQVPYGFTRQYLEEEQGKKTHGVKHISITYTLTSSTYNTFPRWWWASNKKWEHLVIYIHLSCQPEREAQHTFSGEALLWQNHSQPHPNYTQWHFLSSSILSNGIFFVSGLMESTIYWH